MKKLFDARAAAAALALTAATQVATAQEEPTQKTETTERTWGDRGQDVWDILTGYWADAEPVVGDVADAAIDQHNHFQQESSDLIEDLTDGDGESPLMNVEVDNQRAAAAAKSAHQRMCEADFPGTRNCDQYEMN